MGKANKLIRKSMCDIERQRGHWAAVVFLDTILAPQGKSRTDVVKTLFRDYLDPGERTDYRKVVARFLEAWDATDWRREYFELLRVWRGHDVIKLVRSNADIRRRK